MSIKLENVSYTYMKNTPYERTALKEVTLTIEKGEYVAVIGHTGSGKSTLMQHFNGLLKPDLGKVSVDDVDINGKAAAAKNAKNRVGMVFQYPEHQIFAETVYEDVAFGPRNKGLSEEEVEIQVKSALKFVGLDYDSFASRSPFQLSGGQMRRVAIAGVVAMEPDYLILDEPSAGLDPCSRDSIFREINELYQTRKMAVILVTHSMEEAAQYAQRLLVMSKGRIVIDGSSAEVFQNQREMLSSVGVDVPQTIKLADTLREHGLQIGKDILRIDELVNQIKKEKGWL
ncbi:MAG: energy-coupling factor transporter ATPase [Negativicutes bacterium]|nr:energy-coupling factor transporter ATPase [Negativicutes bacterium]